MSLPDMKGFGPLRRLAVVLACLALAGCFRPLYASLPAGGNVADELKAVEIGLIVERPGQERIAHYLRQELAFDLDGSGQPQPKRYRLELTGIAEEVATATLNTEVGRADSAIFTGAVSYVLKTSDGGAVTTGLARASATYDRVPSRFANVRAARDAQIKVAKLLAEQIQTRLAATFASRS